MVAKLSREVAAVLADEIRALPAGHRFESEKTIMSRFEVSRSTVRSALQELEDQYLVRRIQGSGTYVNRRIDYVISRTKRPSMHETIAAAGGRPHTLLIDAGFHPVPEDLAQRLGIEAGTPTQRLIRLSYIDDAVSGYSEEWINGGVCDYVDVGLKVIESLDQVLRARGFEPVRAWCRIGMENPAAQINERLELVRSTQTWVVESLTRDKASGRPLMCSITWTRPDTVRMDHELEE